MEKLKPAAGGGCGGNPRALLLFLTVILSLLFFFLRYSSPFPAIAALRGTFSRSTTAGRSAEVVASNPISSGGGHGEVAWNPIDELGERDAFTGEGNRSAPAPAPMGGRCNIYAGEWVRDESYPLYRGGGGGGCPFVDEAFSCAANGRPDTAYARWRWQPHGCSIPRFDAAKMLETLRGKRLVFAGDSIGRNQWESMLCLLLQAVKDPARVREARRRTITKERGQYEFRFLDYGCSVEYYVSHFLVKESKARAGRRKTKTLRLDAVDGSSSRWKGADILVFNTDHWWSHHKTKAGVNYFQEGDYVHPRLDADTAFRKALATWADWVDRHAEPGRTKVFFRSSSPSHFSGGEWNSGGHCKEAVQPLNATARHVPPGRTLILDEVLRRMKTPVTVLNITGLSGLRIDGHPSVYGRSPASPRAQDCSHWCLPGVPDSWNQLLYYHLVSTDY